MKLLARKHAQAFVFTALLLVAGCGNDPSSDPSAHASKTVVRVPDACKEFVKVSQKWASTAAIDDETRAFASELSESVDGVRESDGAELFAAAKQLQAAAASGAPDALAEAVNGFGMLCAGH